MPAPKSECLKVQIKNKPYPAPSERAAAFVANLVLCYLLVPSYGGYGAAAATTLALAFETVLLFIMVRWKLGLHVLAFGKRHS